MADQVTLKRTVLGEYGPQYWTMTGGTFDEMLTAVKALPVRQWESLEKVWSVKGDGINALRAAGYKVSMEHDTRVELRLDQTSIHDEGDHLTVDILVNYRNSRGDWTVSAVVAPSITKTLIVPITEEQVAPIADEVKKDEITLKHISPQNLESYARRNAILRLGLQAMAEYDKEVYAVYKQHIGKRTADERKTALQAVKQFVAGEINA